MHHVRRLNVESIPQALIALGMFLIGLLSAVAQTQAEKRVALVIGNGNYLNAPKLPNPRNDAQDVAAALKRTGFDTIVALDVEKSAMDDAEIRFARAARDADIALFYYSGHAMQYNGINYLMPIDAKLTDEADLRRMARVDDLVADLQQAKNLRILILDSCRDNPFAEDLKRSIGRSRGASIQRGLAKIDNPQGMIVSYATQAGRTAEDGRGRNSPYTSAFLKHIETQEEIGTVFRHVADDVYQSTNKTQLPEISLSVIGEFYLHGRLQVHVDLPASPAVPPNAAGSQLSEAAQAWAATKDTRSVAVLEDFIRQFGTTVYGSMARARLEELKSNRAVAQQRMAVVTPPTHPGPALNISGVWLADDGGTYAIRQSGADITWEGFSGNGGRRWTHTFNGALQGNVIVGKFFDHPPGAARGAGDLSVKVVNNGRLEKVQGTGGNFGGSVWTLGASANRISGTAPNVAGIWRANDGGTYTVKQSGNAISWEGVAGDGGQAWTHTFNGVLQDDIVVGQFFDHPPGAARGIGNLAVKVINNNRLEKVLGTGRNFGGSLWTR